MEIALTLLLGGAFLGVGLLHRRHRLRGWQNAAVECGLEVLKAASWRHGLTARAGPVEVKIEPCGNKGQYARIIVSLPVPPRLQAVSIRHEPLLRRSREVEIGDRSFDRELSLEGPAPQILALLDAETRSLLIQADAASDEEMVISSGTIRASDLSDRQVPQVLPLLLDIGRRLMQPMDIPRRLAENARQDPEAGVRLQNLLALVRERRGAPSTIEALRTACSDPSPEIRLRAAQALGAEGRGVLFELAEGLEDDASSAQAVAHLGRELTCERTQSILLGALRRRLIQTAHACLDWLGESGDAAAVDALAKVMAVEKGELAPAAALALGATGDPAAEPPLLLALQREEADLRVAAATALGRAGSAAAVLPLKEAAERSWLDLDLRRATRQAIAEIQSRLQGASPGQLSLAGDEAGQLSLAQAEAGQLSLAPAEPDQLALASHPAGRLSLPPNPPGQLSIRGEKKG